MDFAVFLLNRSCFNWWLRKGGTFSPLRFSKGGSISCNQFLWVRMHNIEYTVIGANPKHFFTIREGDIGYTLQSSSNSFGQYLAVTKLKVGGLRRSIIILASKVQHGWRAFGIELRRMLEPTHYA